MLAKVWISYKAPVLIREQSCSENTPFPTLKSATGTFISTYHEKLMKCRQRDTFISLFYAIPVSVYGRCTRLLLVLSCLFSAPYTKLEIIMSINLDTIK